MRAKPVPVLCGTRLDRFLSRIDPRASGCWQWTGRIDQYGYGVMTIGKDGRGGNHFKAHRLSYVYFVGDLADDLTIDHLCRNHACVNPTHLEAVSVRVNVARGTTPTVLRERNKHQYWWTPDVRAKIAAANRRREWTPEARAKITAANLRRTPELLAEIAALNRRRAISGKAV